MACLSVETPPRLGAAVERPVVASGGRGPPGRGLFTEGLRYFLGDTFNHTDSQRLFAGVEGHNRAALRCHEKAGFTHVAALSTRHRLGSGTSTGALEPDHVGLALTADGPGR